MKCFATIAIEVHEIPASKRDYYLAMKRSWITNEIELVKPTNVQHGAVCCGIIFHSSPTIFIDTCLLKGEICKLLREQQPEIVLCTHFHLDHSRMLQFVPHHSNASMFLPRGESQYLNHLEKYVELLALPDEQSKQPWLDLLIQSGLEESATYLAYDDSSDIGMAHPNRMQVIPTPGHSPNHKSFYFPEEKLLFSGDIGLDDFGPWYGFTNCSILDYIESIFRLMSLDIEAIIPSHGKMITTNIDGEFRKCLLIILTREKMILNKLEKGYSQDQITKEGVIHRDKHLIDEPFRSSLYLIDRIALHSHLKIIEAGGISKYFPRMGRLDEN